MKINPNQYCDIVNAFSNQLESMVSIGKRYGVTRQTIHRVLSLSGVPIGESGKMAVTCAACGAGVVRYRSRIRKNKNHFCNMDCYSDYLEAGNGNPYIQNRQGQRIGRAIVSNYYDLQPGQIVHHVDRNTLNNLPKNLMVFANQGDHTRHHRGFDVDPVWVGLDVS